MEMEVSGVMICTDRSHRVGDAVPVVLPANGGKSLNSIFLGKVAEGARKDVSKLLDRVQQEENNVLLCAFEEEGRLRRRAVFCPTDGSEYYGRRYGRDSIFMGSAWKDFYYHTFYAALSIVEKKWKADQVDLINITQGVQQSEPMFEAQLDALQHIKRAEASSVTQICMHLAEPETLKKAISAERSSRSETVRFFQLDPAPNVKGHQLRLWQVEVPNRLTSAQR